MPESELQPGQFGTSDFAAERSTQDALLSNQNARAASQAAVLINGGAATAMLAFLSKDKIANYFLQNVPFTLVAYAAGVCFGAGMVFCAGQALNHWSRAWRIYMVNVDKPEESNAENLIGEKWNSWAQLCYVASMACFIGGSVGLALIMYFAPVEFVMPGPG